MKDIFIIPCAVGIFLVVLGVAADAPPDNIAKAAGLWAALTAAPGILAELWLRWKD